MPDYVRMWGHAPRPVHFAEVKSQGAKKGTVLFSTQVSACEMPRATATAIKTWNSKKEKKY